MAKLTNLSGGPKAISTTNLGVVVLQPGESRDDLEVSKDDMAAIERHKLLEAPEGGGTPSLADMQREIASSSPVAPADQPEGEGDNTLPAEDDAEVKALVDDNDAKALRDLAKAEGVELESDDNKPDVARKIIAKRRS